MPGGAAVLPTTSSFFRFAEFIGDLTLPSVSTFAFTGVLRS